MERKYTKPNKGEVFGLWTVISEEEVKTKTGYVILCECSCKRKTQRLVNISNLHKGTSTCCGCEGDKKLSDKARKHGMSDTTFFKKYRSIKQRCNNPKSKYYINYGGRGIKLSDEWMDFENFKNDMYESYLEHCDIYGSRYTTIERKDVNGNYCKENCVWATPKEQANNRRDNNYIEYNGDIKTVQEWSEFYNIEHGTIRTRLQRGWSFEEVFEIKERVNPKGYTIVIEGKEILLRDYAKSLGLNGDTVVCYVKRHNLTPEQSIERCLKNKNNP